MFKIQDLKYDISSFHKLSQKSFEIHYGKHHQGYVNNLNALIERDLAIQNKSLEEVVRYSYSKRNDVFYKKVFNNAAQHWNHTFFWDSITPNKKIFDLQELIDSSNIEDDTQDLPIQDDIRYEKEILKEILKDYGSFSSFYFKFEEVGLNAFGSAWIWITYNADTHKIEITSTSNAETPIQIEKSISCLTPLLVCDIWEHSYYIDYLNDRKSYLQTIFEYFDWSFAGKNYENR